MISITRRSQERKNTSYGYPKSSSCRRGVIVGPKQERKRGHHWCIMHEKYLSTGSFLSACVTPRPIYTVRDFWRSVLIVGEVQEIDQDGVRSLSSYATHLSVDAIGIGWMSFGEKPHDWAKCSLGWSRQCSQLQICNCNMMLYFLKDRTLKAWRSLF